MHQFNVIIQVTKELNTTIEARDESEAAEIARIECAAHGEVIDWRIERNMMLDEEIDPGLMMFASQHSVLK